MILLETYVRKRSLDPFNSRRGVIKEIVIEKSADTQLGITIDGGGRSKAGSAASNSAGVFVSSVGRNSLAALVGMQVGDQLLDVCGINLRTCGKEQAALVLHQVGNSVTMKVQFNPEDYYGESGCEGDSEDEDEEEEEDVEEDDDEDGMEEEVGMPSERHPSVRAAKQQQQQQPGMVSASSPPRSGTPTPKNSPRGSQRGQQQQQQQMHRQQQQHLQQLAEADNRENNNNPPSLPPSAHSTLTRHHVQQVQNPIFSKYNIFFSISVLFQVVTALQAHPPRAPASPPYETRLLFPTMKKPGDLGVRLVRAVVVSHFRQSGYKSFLFNSPNLPVHFPSRLAGTPSASLSTRSSRTLPPSPSAFAGETRWLFPFFAKCG